MSTTRRSRSGGGRAGGPTWVVLLLALGAASGALGQPRALSQRWYFDHDRCGTVDLSRLPPRTTLGLDLDEDGQVEFYVATWGGVERHHQQRGSHPPVLIRDALIYSSSSNSQYSCVDLTATDVDGDGDLDLVFGAHRELVILENDGGRLRLARRTPQELPVSADPRLELRDGQLVLSAR